MSFLDYFKCAKDNIHYPESFFLASLRKQKNHIPTHVMLGKSRYYQGNQKAAAEAFRNLLKQHVNKGNASTLFCTSP